MFKPWQLLICAEDVQIDYSAIGFLEQDTVYESPLGWRPLFVGLFCSVLLHPCS